MSEQAFRNLGLDSLLEETAQYVRQPVISIATNVGHINLRGNLQDSAFSNGVQSALGLPLPETAGGMSRDQHRICWLGPDEWLITTTADDAGSVLERLCKELHDQHIAINDQSGGLVELRLDGSEWLDILAGGCAVDLRSEYFAPGKCLQAALAKATVLLCRISADSSRLVVRRSFADYVVRWLINAAPDHKARLISN